jgi:Zinc finger, C3HC4 type (RING finger)
MPHCSYCRNPGHNIRSCNDPSIWALWKSLIVTFLIPKIGSAFTIQDKWSILGFLSSEYSEDTVRAACIGITRKNHGSASYVQHHHRNDLYNYMVDLLRNISDQPVERRTYWISRFTGELRTETEEANPINDEVDVLIQNEVDIEDPDSVTWIEDRTPMPITVEPSFPIINPIMLCLETHSELQTLVECAICQEDKPTLDSNTTNCGHSFCHGCITRHIESKGKRTPPCPLCRTPITSLEIKDVENFCSIEHRFGRTASILKDCIDRIFLDPDFGWAVLTHKQIIDIIVSELTDQYYPSSMHEVDSMNTDQEKAEALWRYLWIRGIGDHHHRDISYEEFVQGMNTAMQHLENMPDLIDNEIY